MKIGFKEFFILLVIASFGIYCFTVETELARYKRQEVFYIESFKPVSKEKACAILKMKAFQDQSLLENSIFHKCYD